MKTEFASVLVIEDNPATLSLLFHLLDQAGFEVLISKDGESALTSAEEAQPDIILLDVLMSGINGFETCQRLKASEKTKDIPVIFMTALTKTVDKIRGFKLGAVDYITKPIEPEEVLMRIKTHLMIQKLQQDLQTRNEELHASLEREQELNKLKSRFLSIASHEFRTPLSTILFSSNLLRRYSGRIAETAMTADMQEECDVIERAIEQMTATLDEVLMLSKSESENFIFKPILLDLGELCQMVIEKFKVISAATHTMTFTNAVKPIQISADPKLLEHILSNLLSNAIKFSPQGSSVFCELTEQEDAAIISIKDEGIGISEEEQHQIFESFYRGTNVEKIQGTGLGLSIVKQFIELHGGTISVESQLHTGSTFNIILPLRK